MPKSYTDQERDYICKRLKEEAAKCLVQYGIRHTTVDEIVKRVKIPKGTFYLFYKSKESLLFEVVLEQHELIEQKIYQEMSRIDPLDVSAEQLTDILFKFYQYTMEFPIFKVIDSDAITMLAQKLPKGVLDDHFKHDGTMIERILSNLPIKPGIDYNAVTSAFRSLYFTTLHKDETGGENYEKGLRLLISGLVTQLI